MISLLCCELEDLGWSLRKEEVLLNIMQRHYCLIKMKFDHNSMVAEALLLVIMDYWKCRVVCIALILVCLVTPQFLSSHLCSRSKLYGCPQHSSHTNLEVNSWDKISWTKIFLLMRSQCIPQQVSFWWVMILPVTRKRTLVLIAINLSTLYKFILTCIIIQGNF